MQDTLSAAVEVTTKEPTKFCKNCHHRRSGSDANWQFWSCAAPQLNTAHINPVNGEPIKSASSCHAARYDPDLCGKEGKWFQTVSMYLDKRYPPMKSNRPISLDDL